MAQQTWIVPRQHQIHFDVSTTGSSNPHLKIKLTHVPYQVDTNTYEIRLGQTSGDQVECVIYDMDQAKSVAQTYTKNLFTEGRFTSFWISWRNESITVGMGHSSNTGTTLLRMTGKMSFSVKAVSFTSERTTCEWHLSKTLGE